MRLQSIQQDGSFKEFTQVPFSADHEETVLEDWLEQNPQTILEDSPLLVIGRQVPTNLRTFIDLLGIDRWGDVVVVELKRDKTPRDAMAQALEYASFVDGLDVDQLEDLFRKYSGEESALMDHHRQYFNLDSDEAVAFNKDQRIVLVGQSITREIRQTAAFLRRKGIRVTCLEFSFFTSEENQRLLSSDIVVGHESPKPRDLDTRSLRKIDKEEFLGSLDENGLALFKHLFELADRRGYLFHWGTHGFSLNVDLDGTHVALCFGYRRQCVMGQSLYTVLFRRGGLLSKTAAPPEVAIDLSTKLRQTGLVVEAGRESKCVLDRRLDDAEVNKLLSWIEELEGVIRSHGLPEGT